ncbi:MAG TPA: hypothetical protein VMP89_17325, partial [Solirubrobacteraceae bacterium]|nr:hypothetical protein [Solirubrobacteraceae bacterium]
ALPEPVAGEVRDHLADSASERAWARVVASELQGLAREPLPEIPTEARPPAGVATPAAASAAPAAVEEPEPAPPRRQPRGERADRPSSRRGGALLLGAGAVVVVAVVLVLVLTGGSSSSPKHHVTAAASGTTAAQGATGTTGSTQVVAQINLKPPTGGTKPLGLAEVLKVQGKTGIAIVAQGLAANSKRPPNAYAVWLYNSPGDSHILGFVNPAVGSNGQLRTAGALPTNAHHYQKLLVTLETVSTPKTPGQIVLEGTLTGV